MYFEEQYLDEIYYMKHRHDNDNDYVDYPNKIFSNTLSPHLFNNDVMSEYLDKLKRCVTILFDNFNIIKNFKNFNVNKYKYKNKN